MKRNYLQLLITTLFLILLLSQIVYAQGWDQDLIKNINSLEGKIFIFPALAVLLGFEVKALSKLIQNDITKWKDSLFNIDNFAFGYDIIIGSMLTLVSEIPNHPNSEGVLMGFAFAIFIILFFIIVLIVVTGYEDSQDINFSDCTDTSNCPTYNRFDKLKESNRFKELNLIGLCLQITIGIIFAFLVYQLLANAP